MASSSATLNFGAAEAEVKVEADAEVDAEEAMPSKEEAMAEHRALSTG